MSPLVQKLLIEYKTANPKWGKQHIPVKLGHHLRSRILLWSMSETHTLTQQLAVLEQRVIYRATYFPSIETMTSLVTVNKSIH